MTIPKNYTENSTEDDDCRSFIFVLSLNEAKDKPETAKTRFVFFHLALFNSPIRTFALALLKESRC